jgi:hypothetical protein
MQFEANRKRTTVAAMSIVVLFALGLLLPGPAAAKEKEYLTGKVMDAKFNKKDKCTLQMSKSTAYCKYYRLIVQVEDMTYQVDYEEEHGVFGSHYKFKEEDWPINSEVQVRLKVQSLLGVRHTWMYVKRANGKEIECLVESKTGPDGKELCGMFRC